MLAGMRSPSAAPWSAPRACRALRAGTRGRRRAAARGPSSAGVTPIARLTRAWACGHEYRGSIARRTLPNGARGGRARHAWPRHDDGSERAPSGSAPAPTPADAFAADELEHRPQRALGLTELAQQPPRGVDLLAAVVDARHDHAAGLQQGQSRGWKSLRRARPSGGSTSNAAPISSLDLSAQLDLDALGAARQRRIGDPHEPLGKSLSNGHAQRLPHRGHVLHEPPVMPAGTMLCHADSVRRSLDEHFRPSPDRRWPSSAEPKGASAYAVLGSGTAMTVRSSIPGEVRRVTGIEGKVVGDGSRRNHRVVRPRCGLPRPARRSDAATRPNARAAWASKGSGSKSASACWRCAWRAARSCSSRRDEGADGELRECHRGDERLSRSAEASATCVSRMTVEVSRTPRSARGALLTGSCPGTRRRLRAERQDRQEEVGATGQATSPRRAVPARRAQLGDRFARARDRDRLAARGAVDDVAAMVAQLADAHLGHESTVSHVIHRSLP